MANISSLVNVYWFMGKRVHWALCRLIIDTNASGIPFNDTSNFRLEIAEKGQAILGPYLVGLQVGNEPDLYAKHFRRPAVRVSPLLPQPSPLTGRNDRTTRQVITPVNLVWWSMLSKRTPSLPTPTCSSALILLVHGSLNSRSLTLISVYLPLKSCLL